MKKEKPKTITREQVRANFSLQLHTLASKLVFDKLNIFEKKYVAQMLTRIEEPKYSKLRMDNFARVNNMYVKYVGYPKPNVRE